MASIEVIRERFKREGIMSEQLPITLDNGCQFTELKGTCGHCKQVVQDNALRGVIKKVFGAVIFDGHGLCLHCAKLFPVFGRVKPDGSSIKYEFIHNGAWVYSLMVPDTAYVRIKLAIRAWFKALIQFRQK